MYPKISWIWRVCCVCICFAPIAVLSQVSEPDFFPELENPMVFHEAYSGGNCDSCVWISAQGEITLETPRLFEAFWEEIKHGFEGTSIHLNSRGGDLGSALALGRMFRETGLATVVAETAGFNGPAGPRDGFLETDAAVCESACVFAFIGGVNRAASRLTDGEETGYQRIGSLRVHQFSSKSDGDVFTSEERVQDQIRTAVLLDYVIDMGVSADLLGLALSIPPDQDLYTLSEGDIRNLQLDTYVSDASPYLRGYPNGVGVVEVEKTTRRGSYRYEFFCDAQQQAMLKITFVDSEIDPTLPDDSNSVAHAGDFLRSLSVPLPGEAVLTSINTREEQDVSQKVVEAVYRAVGSNVADLIGKTSFRFGHGGNSYQGFLALDMNLELAEPFDGFHLLPRLCLK